MAAPHVQEAMKLLAQRAGTSKTRARIEALQDVVRPSVCKPDFPEPALKMLMRLLLPTAERYRDVPSQRAVESVVVAAVGHHGDAAVKQVLAAVSEIGRVVGKTSPSAANGSMAYTGLRWASTIVEPLLKSSSASSAEFKQLVASLGEISSAVLSDPRKPVHIAVHRCFTRIFNKLSIEPFLTAAMEQPPSQAVLCLCHYIVRHADSKKDASWSSKMPGLLDVYIKCVVSSKTAVPAHVLKCTSVLLAHVSHEQFKDVLLPAIERGLLRSPELLIPSLSSMLSGVSLDLSAYAMAIGKRSGTQLHSQDPLRRQAAICAITSLAKQCSDDSAVLGFTKHLFAVLGGSEGKLTGAEQRIGVLSGIGAMASNSVAGGNAIQTLAAAVINLFLPILQAEVHEGTLVHCASMASAWSYRLSSSVPDELLTAIKKNMALKTASSAVRFAYLQLLSGTLKGNMLAQGASVIPLLQQAVERAVAQPHQVSVVSEAMAASCLLAQLSVAQIEADSKFTSFWQAVLDPSKQLLVAEKIIAQASTDALLQLLQFVQSLFFGNEEHLTSEKSRPFYTALAWCLVHRCDAVRRKATAIVAKVTKASTPGDRESGAAVLRSVFGEFLATQKLPVASTDESEGAAAAVSAAKISLTVTGSSHHFVRAFRTVTTVAAGSATGVKEESMAVLLDSLLWSHHPVILHRSDSEWTQLLQRTNSNVDDLLEPPYLDQLLRILKGPALADRSLAVTVAKSAQTLSSVCPKFVATAVKMLLDSVEEPQQVTVGEVRIARTPEGQLCDTSLIDNAKASDTGTVHNMKRESKLYSFEDQKWEMELREELRQKKKQASAPAASSAASAAPVKGAKGGKGGKGGKGAAAAAAAAGNVQLSKKQQEMLEATLKQESATRKSVQAIEDKLVTALSFVECASSSNPFAVREHMPVLVPALRRLLRTPLGAQLACRTWLRLRPVAFDAEDGQMWLGESIANCSLRLLDPPCNLDEAWEQEPLLAQALRVLGDLKSLVAVPEGSEALRHPSPLSAPTFCYCFPLLECVLSAISYVPGVSTFNRVANQLSSEMPTLIDTALRVMAIHCKLRASVNTSVEDVDEDGPDLLPSEGMFRLLSHTIGSATDVKQAKSQQSACSALVTLCETLSGSPGCGKLSVADLANVLLPAMKSSCDELRRAVLNGLLEVVSLIQEEFQLVEDDKPSRWNQDLVDAICCHVWLLKFEEVEINKSLAERLWTSANLSTDNIICSDVISDVSHSEEKVRRAAAQALAAILELDPDETLANCQVLFDVYETHRIVPKAQVDSMGRPTGPAPEDPWPARCGVAMALRHLTPLLQSENLPELFSFYVPKALNDMHTEVRKEMLTAAITAIEEHGKDEVTVLLGKFEDCLSLPDSESSDALRQSIVILMGTLARHLDKTDPKVRPIIQRLIATLDTPSQQVQEAVANCLPALVPAIKDESVTLVASLLAKLLDGEQFALRKGAGYGLAGLVKGLGIGSLKQMNIMPTLTEAVQNKKNYRHREGALFAFEMLCLMLGRLFEPYIIHVLPHLLMCFGDGNNYVREAADDTARAVMQKLSAHGVKLILPSLLTAIEDDSWRTKIGSVELLGAMAYCAPKQLSSCLPSIVPKLTGVLADSHIKVQKAGGQALKQIGAVIKNPEIQVIAPTLLDALADPATHTAAGLRALLDTAFVHMIDAPSLALIMPILQRALEQRKTEIKKMACQIMASMYTLTDHKDLSPYLAAVVPGVKASLLDPLPEVRGVAAKALGAMVKGHGDGSFEELMPWLQQVLTSESNTVDRSGSAQGMSEVLGAQGLSKLNELMPKFVAAAQQLDAAPSYRDGYLMLFVYLPVTFGEAFVPFISDVIPPILKGLADESEYVRETALRAGQRIISMFAETAVAIFLPELELGMFDEHWRIRHSSMQLLGDLLYRLSGVTGKMTTEGDEDDGFGTETSQKAILLALGDDRRNRVLAGIYMGRSDVALLVRQAALHVWKVVVANTPRTLREILPTLFQLLLGCLASTSYDKRQVAARTLGDLVRKLGERVLPDIIPILEKGLLSEESDERQGVCIGLTEIMSSTSRDQVMNFVDSLVPTVRRALCDELPKVRKAAAQTFDRLHNTIGHTALNQILPPLLDMLSQDGEESNAALDGLQQVMAVKSKDVLPFLIPKLTAPPVNSRALAKLASVAGEALTRHIGRILQALLEAIEQAAGTPEEAAELANAELLVLSIVEDMGVQTVVEELLVACKQQLPARRRAAASLLQVFAAKTSADLLPHVPALMRGLLKLFADPDKEVVAAAWEALNAVTKTLSSADQMSHIGHLRQAVKFVADDAADGLLPGFCLGPKKGIAPVLPMLREGILNGPPELKEQAAAGLGEVISMTTPESLKTSVVPIAGPLIRILGDRFSWNIKVAVLETLRILIVKVGVVLKPFLPQLQTTFIKGLNDTNRTVRQKASSALQCLVVLHTRVDPLFTELHNGIKSVEDQAVRETILQALRGVLVGAGKKMSEDVRKSVTTTLVGLLSAPEDEIRTGACSCVGAMCTVTPNDDLASLVRDDLLAGGTSADWTVRHGCALALAEATSTSGPAMEEVGLRGEVVASALSHSQSDRIPVCLAGMQCLGHLWACTVKRCGDSEPVEPAIPKALAANLSHTNGDVRVAAAQSISRAARAGSLPVADIAAVLPPLIAISKEKVSPSKSNADLALVALLKLRTTDACYQAVLAKLDGSLATQLQEVHKRSLHRVAQQPIDDYEDC